LNEVVLDASAFLAFLRNEAGSDKVAGELNRGAYMSAVNWAEVLSKVFELGIDCEKLIYTLKTQGIIGGALEIVPLTEMDGLIIGRLRTATKKEGLSLGDRACLALAGKMKARALTADRSWQNIKLTGVKVEVIR
jgi:PIN domain nuclease of toxin-antitoxin system